VEDDKIVKKRSILFFVSLFFCTFLSFNQSFQQLVKFPDHYLISQEKIQQLEAVWSKLIIVEKESLDQTVAVSSMSEPAIGSQKVEVTYKLFGIFPLKSAQVEVMNPMKLIPGGQSSV